MIDWATIYWGFWSAAILYNGGTLEFHKENLVPTGTEFPYATYSFSDIGDIGNMMLIVRIWDRSTNWLRIYQICEKIAELIPFNGRVDLNLTSGSGQYSLYRPDQPTQFMQELTDEEPNVKSMYINIQVRKRAAT